MIKAVFLLAMTMLFMSCLQNDLEEILFRTTDDPFPDVPLADSLSLEHTIYLTWRPDDACDRFRLMRAHDQPSLSFSCIYEGNDIRYTDSSPNDYNRYVYRLDKTRGGKYFEGKEYAYGYSSDCRKDACEPNDTESEATYLEYDRICNLPCVRYIANNVELLDCDWFYISIPPRRAADVVISQSNLENESEGAATNLKIQVAGSTSKAVRQKVATVINNPSYETKNFFFKVYPETTGLFSKDGCITVIEYTVSLNQIRNYSL